MGAIMVQNYSERRGEHVERRRWTLPQTLAAVVGAVYLLIGIIGFFETGFSDFAEHTGDELLGLGINPLHNVVHIATGLLGLAMAPTLATARIYGWLLLIAYGAIFIYGLWAIDNADDDFLSINTADNWLHGITAFVGLLIALLPVRRMVRTRTEV